MRILVVRMHCVGTSILVDISAGLPRLALTYSIDAFTFAVCVLSVNTGREADIVSFIIASLKRLRVAGTLSISGAGRIRFASARGIRCSARRGISGERGDEVFCLLDSLHKIRQILMIFWSFQDKSDLSIHGAPNGGHDSVPVGSICCERAHVSSVPQHALDRLIRGIGICRDVW